MSVATYTKDMPRAAAFVPLRKNQATESFRVYLDCLVAEDVYFNNYIDHRGMHPFDEIVLYYGLLTCGSHFTTPHLPERVMR